MSSLRSFSKVYDVYEKATPTTEAGAVRRCKTRFCSSQLNSASLRVMNCYCRLWITSGENMREKIVIQHRLYISALASFVTDQSISLRERGVTECILSGYAELSKELLAM